MLNIATSTFLVIFPVITIIMVGYIAKQKQIITKEGIDSISKFVFYIAMPCLIIDEISQTDLASILKLKGPIVLAIVPVIIGSIAYFTAFLKKQPPSIKGSLAQASFRGSSFLTIPIILSAIGNEGLFYSSVILAAGPPIYNTLAVIFLNLPHGKPSHKKYTLAIYIIKGIVKNPLTIAVAIGIILSFIRPPNSTILTLSLSTLKNTTLPLALISIGGQLDPKTSLITIPKAILPIFYKLILSPIIGAFLLYLLNANNQDFVTTMIFLASPTAIISYVLAKEMKGDPQLTSNIILAGILLCFVTYSIMLFLLGILDIWQYKHLL